MSQEVSHDDLTEAVSHLITHVKRIERVLIAQLTEQRDRLDGELSYRRGSARPNEGLCQTIADRLSRVNQQLEELTG